MYDGVKAMIEAEKALRPVVEEEKPAPVEVVPVEVAPVEAAPAEVAPVEEAPVEVALV